VFADPEIRRLAREAFVPVAGDDWYQRRRRDAEGVFYRGMSDQGPRGGAGGGTRQGIYCFTAGGRLLAYRNHWDPEVMRAEIAGALAKYRAMPERERVPATIEPRGEPDSRFHRAPPEGGAVLGVYTRVLDRGPDGRVRRCAELPSGVRGRSAARDHLWLTRDELAGLVVAPVPAIGARRAVPGPVAERIARFHLVDDTRGEPDHWTREQVRTCELALVTADVSAEQIRLVLDGRVLVATDAPAERAARGYDARLAGTLVYDRAAGRFTAIQIVALGEHWGEGRWSPGARPGRATLGVAIELLARPAPADLVPPQGARDPHDYFGQ